VTVYVILDMGFSGGNTCNAQPTTINKSTALSVQQAGLATSRLGFRGAEDLGGGTAAFFTFETGLLPNSNTNNSTDQLSTFNNCQAFIGLSQKGLSRVSMGTQQTTIHDVVGRTTACAKNNVVGDLISTVNGNTSGAAIGTGTSYGLRGGQKYTVRAYNTIKFATENLSGFQGNAMFILNDTTQNTATSGGSNDSTGSGLGVNYT
jgi:predicted porin